MLVRLSVFILCLFNAYGETFRESGTMTFNPDFCVCKSARAAMGLDRCEDFCSTKADPIESLYATFSINQTLMGNTQVTTVKEWCSVPLQNKVTGNFEMINPSCVIEAVSGEGTIVSFSVDALNFTSENALQINLTNLENYTSKEWKITLAERNSGAKSDTITIIRKD